MSIDQGLGEIELTYLRDVSNVMSVSLLLIFCSDPQFTFDAGFSVG